MLPSIEQETEYDFSNWEVAESPFIDIPYEYDQEAERKVYQEGHLHIETINVNSNLSPEELKEINEYMEMAYGLCSPSREGILTNPDL